MNVIGGTGAFETAGGQLTGLNPWQYTQQPSAKPAQAASGLSYSPSQSYSTPTAPANPTPQQPVVSVPQVQSPAASPTAPTNQSSGYYPMLNSSSYAQQLFDQYMQGINGPAGGTMQTSGNM